jgi:AcrR family transcriptional regulator
MTKKEKAEKVLETSLKAFSRYGFRKTTVEEIAAEAGMTKGNLYLYFKDKRDLYVQTVAFGLRRWQHSAAGALKGVEDVEQQLITYCRKGDRGGRFP